MTTPTLASFTGARDRLGGVRLVHDTGYVEHHDVGRWWRDADEVDRRAVARCDGPTVDIGCGPGRLSLALTARAVTTLGIDVCRDAVETTRARGAAAIRRDVFATLPGEGRWHWALLADGNVGIGGDPERLLRRVAQVVGPLAGCWSRPARTTSTCGAAAGSRTPTAASARRSRGRCWEPRRSAEWRAAAGGSSARAGRTAAATSSS